MSLKLNKSLIDSLLLRMILNYSKELVVARFHQDISVIALFSALVAPGGPAAAQEGFAGSVFTDTDRWMYPFNVTPGHRPAGSIFGFVSVPPSEDFDNRDAQIIVSFDTTGIVPAGEGADAYEIESITVEMTLSGQASGPLDTSYDVWQTYLPGETKGSMPDADPGRPIELFAAGFRFGYTRTTWEEDTIFSETGPFGTNNRTVFTAGFDGSGALVDVSSHINEQVDVSPLAIAGFPGLTDGDTPPEGAVATFDLDLTDVRTRDWISESLNEGRIFFAISSLIFAAQGDGILTQFYLRENPLVDAGVRDAASITMAGSFGGTECPMGDLDGDCLVTGADLGALLSAWGTDDPAADLDGSGVVNGGDLGVMLAGW